MIQKADPVDILILAGGENRRMQGRFKGALPTAADPASVTFLDRLIAELAPHTEHLRISGKSDGSVLPAGIPVIADIYPGCGPIGGIHAGLSSASGDWTAVAACDMPLLTWELYEYLLSYRTSFADAILPTLKGKYHPLAGLYRHRLLPLLEEAIRNRDYKLLIPLQRSHLISVPLDSRPDLAAMLVNINTPEEYLRHTGIVAEHLEKDRIDQGTSAKHGDGVLHSAASPAFVSSALITPFASSAVPVIAVCGVKNSGKTTLLAGLIRVLTDRGLRIAAIKHDGHDFTCDIPGTDSDRLHRAGACGTAVYSSQRIFLHRENGSISGSNLPADLIPLFPEADLIFIEGGKSSAFPKIEVVRDGISDTPSSNPEGRFLIATDLPEDRRIFPDPAADLNDIEGITDIIIRYIKGR